YDRARVAAQVVSGIGFIGAGVIIFQKNAVRGVTTAAGLWVAAAIGLASGAGMYTVSIAATLMTIICLEAMHFITHKVGEKILTVTIFSVENDRLSSIIEAIKNMGADIHLLTVTGSEATFDLHVKHRLYLSTVEKILSMTKGLKVEIS
ncbi:MAG: MgtC/SapB family protein, partial [Bacteroidales bacterium]|nr:MgtC/SapB family protein [Bacteroidales bacterium]